MENSAILPRLSVVLCVRPSIADLAGVALPPTGFVSRKAEVERSASTVLREINGVMDPVGAELVIVDPESPEDIAGHLKSIFADEIIRGKLQVVTCPATFDIARMKNFGAQKAQGAWLSFLQPGDTWLPGRLNSLERQLSGADLILGYTGPEVPLRADWIRTLISGDVPPDRFVTGAALIRRTLFEKIDGYLEGRYLQLIDHDLWVRALLEMRDQKLGTDRLLITPCTDVEKAQQIDPPAWIKDGQHALTLVGGMNKLPLRLWPAAIRRVVSILLNR